MKREIPRIVKTTFCEIFGYPKMSVNKKFNFTYLLFPSFLQSHEEYLIGYTHSAVFYKPPFLILGFKIICFSNKYRNIFSLCQHFVLLIHHSIGFQKFAPVGSVIYISDCTILRKHSFYINSRIHIHSNMILECS